MKGLDSVERDAIQTKANELRQEYSMETDYCIDVVALAQKMGFIIIDVDLGLCDDDGFILVNEDEDSILGYKTSKLIGVNQNRTFEDKRFIVAHELGHQVLHNNGKIFAMRENHIGKGEDENDVDYFAACLLMPKEIFTDTYNRLKTSVHEKYRLIEELSNIFKTSVLSVLRRIDELGLDNGE